MQRHHPELLQTPISRGDDLTGDPVVIALNPTYKKRFGGERLIVNAAMKELQLFYFTGNSHADFGNAGSFGLTLEDTDSKRSLRGLPVTELVEILKPTDSQATITIIDSSIPKNTGLIFQ